MMMFWDSGWAWWQAGLMWLAMIAFWALLIWLIYALVTGVIGRGGSRNAARSAVMMPAASWTSGWLAVRSTSRNTSGSVT